MSLTQEVHAKLKELILRTEYAPGSVLYEQEVASRFDVSKTPVREAFLLLAQAGWVVTMPRRGYMVRPVELRDVREVFTMRRMIEPKLAAAAAAHSTAQQIEELSALVEVQAAGDIAEGLEAARRFHLYLASIVSNKRVEDTLEGLVDEVVRLHFLLPAIEEHITSAEELRAHREILNAIRSRDSANAERIMEAHLLEVAHELVQGFTGT